MVTFPTSTIKKLLAQPATRTSAMATDMVNQYVVFFTQQIGNAASELALGDGRKTVDIKDIIRIVQAASPPSFAAFAKVYRKPEGVKAK